MTRGSVVISGLGLAGPLGLGRVELARRLDEGLGPVELGEIRLEDHLAAEKTYLDPNSELALVATSLALRDAGIEPTAPSPPLGTGDTAGTLGMNFGTRLGNVTTTEAYLKMIREQGVKLASPLLFIHAYPNTSVSLCAIEFGIKGTCYNFNSGRWCGLQGLIGASDELRRGKMSVMLAGASDTYTEVTRPDAVGRAYRAAVTVACERVADAAARGARPLVDVAGGGLAGTAPEALSRALAEASVGQVELDWVLLDASEETSAALDLRTHTTNLVVSIGDCGAATAMLGVALAALAIGDPGVSGRLGGIGLSETPRTAAVVSADETGAAAVILRKLAD
ncbi:MAG TPA: beta-ketoacyl synthase N-terminal-like domain-containing protein [Planctomycetota bacterium]|nr:beta-ketoacyl synthase N-terminal-like domain-containing protein [Planctomycetota bacterium]